MNISKLYAVTYEDDGPNGICGQSCDITSPWRKLYLFETEEKLREFAKSIEGVTGRRNARFTYIYYPFPFSNGDINFVAG